MLELIEVQVISSDGAYALSASWDKTLRLWELATGVTTRRFVGHTNDVLSVSFSADNRQIVSGSRDRTIKLWNTLGDCKFTITDKGHTEWVSCVRFSPNPQNPVIVSAGWDKLVKVRGSILRIRRENFVRGCFVIFKYLLLQSFRAMRQPLTGALMTTMNTFAIALYVYYRRFAKFLAPHRSGNSPPAASKPTTSATPVTSTPLPSPPTAPSAPQVAKTAQPCSGISTNPSIYTP